MWRHPACIAALVAGALVASGRDARGRSFEAELAAVAYDDDGDGDLDVTANLGLEFYVKGLAPDNNPPPLRSFLQKKSTVRVDFVDVGGGGDPLLNIDLEVFLPVANVTVSIDATVFNAQGAAASAGALLGFVRRPHVWDYAYTEYDGQYWSVGASVRVGKYVSIGAPIFAGTLNDTSPAKSFELAFDWVGLRLVVPLAAGSYLEARFDLKAGFYSVAGLLHTGKLSAGYEVWGPSGGVVPRRDGITIAGNSGKTSFGLELVSWNRWQEIELGRLFLKLRF